MSDLQSSFAAIDALTGPDNWLVAATCKGLLEGYHARWATAQAGIELITSEQTYIAPLRNLETGSDSRTFKLAGKLDKVTRDNGIVLEDHKTTSMEIEDPAGPYWRQLAIESQAKHYELLLFANGIKIDRIVWDVVRKPGIRPKKLTAANRKGVTSLGEYCGRKLSSETRQLFVTEERENAELFQARLAVECLEHPERYFARRSIPRGRNELVDYINEVWQMGQEILASRRNGWTFRNSKACMQWGSACEYLGICSGYDTPESDNWTTRDNTHAELGDTNETKELLTNSRLTCYQTCRRKHYYRYDLGIERVDAEEREALFFGTVWHAGLDAWWAANSKQRKESDEQ